MATSLFSIVLLAGIVAVLFVVLLVAVFAPPHRRELRGLESRAPYRRRHDAA